MHFERTPLAVLEWDRRERITAWNPAAEAIFGFPAYEALGKTMATLLGSRAASARTWRPCAGSCSNRARATRPRSRTRRAAARTIHCEWYNTPLVDADGRVSGFASLVHDVTERLNTERTIHYMAHHDALTGLPNRRLMQDRLNQAIMAARRKQRHVARALPRPRPLQGGERHARATTPATSS